MPAQPHPLGFSQVPPSSPGHTHHSSLPLTAESRPGKLTFPVCVQSCLGSLGIGLALVFSGSHCPCLWCHHCAWPPDTSRAVTGQHVPTLVAEGLALAGETQAASVSDVWAQRPDDQVVRGSDPSGFGPCSRHSRTLGDLTQLPILWALLHL